jgi:hypothetical protein
MRQIPDNQEHLTSECRNVREKQQNMASKLTSMSAIFNIGFRYIAGT